MRDVVSMMKRWTPTQSGVELQEAKFSQIENIETHVETLAN